MRGAYAISLGVLFVVVLASGFVFADQSNNPVPRVQSPKVAQPPASIPQQPTCPTLRCPPVDCCEIAPQTCGAFCQAGQLSPGWPYNWCSEYWVRPNTNY
jgi:hypothetical protein